MTKPGSATELPSGATDLAVFCADLMSATHAMAQPLTVLRTRFDTGLIRRMGLVAFHQLADDTARDVERLCGLFGCLQELIAIESFAPKLMMQNVGHVVAVVVDEMRISFIDAGVILHLQRYSKPFVALMDTVRTHQGLSIVLRVAQQVCGRGDRVDLAVSVAGGFVRISVRTT